MSNIKQTKDGLVEKSTGRKIRSPLDMHPGDVIFSKEHDSKVTVREVLDTGVLCDWFSNTKHNQGLIPFEKLL